MNLEEFKNDLGKETEHLGPAEFVAAIDRLISSQSHVTNNVVVMEECGELSQAVAKCLRGYNVLFPSEDAYYSLLEEMADVTICINMLLRLYRIPQDLLDHAVDVKMKRNLKRIGKYAS